MANSRAAGAPRPPGFNTKSPTIKRILQESRELSLSPDPTVTAAPLETNLFEWHFTITGPPSSPYADGIYHGRIILPSTYPLRPPSFRFLTPTGRFEVNREICLSISGHHEETWQPAWGIRTALTAIRAFMAGDAKGQVGGIDSTKEARETMAVESRGWRCAGCGGRSNGEIIKECEEEWQAAHKEGEAHKEDEVPEELRLAFREDLGKATETDPMEEKKSAEIEAEAVAAAEASLSSDPSMASKLVSGTAATTSSSLQSGSPSSPTRRDVAPGPRIQAPASIAARHETIGTSRPRVTLAATSTPANPQLAGSGVPGWVDKAIVGISILLIYLLIQIFAGSKDLEGRH